MPKTFKKIVVTTDFSGLSTAAISFIQSCEAFVQATVYLLHVMELSPIVALTAGEYPAGKILDHVGEDAVNEFAEFVRTHVPPSLKVDAIIRNGEPAREIIRFAQEIGADLVVIATHGRTGLSHMVLGSVAERVVRFSPVPVLTIKPESMREGIIRQNDVDEQLHLAPMVLE